MKKLYKSNTFLAAVSFIFAVFIWIYVVYDVNPMFETWITDVPVECINVSNLFDDGNLVITGQNENLIEGGTNIDIRIKGKRSVVSSIKKKNFNCTLDLITVNKDGSYAIRPSIENDVSGLEIVKAEPYNIKFTVEKMVQKDIKVSTKTVGELPEGYTIEKVKNHNETVKITGPSSLTDKVKKAELLFDYSELEPSDSEKTCKIQFFDSRGNELDTSGIKKTVEFAKLSFGLYTTKEVTVVLMPKYAEEINKNLSGKSIKLSIDGDGTRTKDGGLEMKVKLKGTATAFEKYIDSKRTVYTEDIDVSAINSDTSFDNVEAAQLSNGIEYVDIPTVKVNAVVESAVQ